MPHLQLDHSPELSPEPLLKILTDEFCKIQTIDPAAVKSYSRAVTGFQPGYQAPQRFIHLTVCVLEGRAPEILEEISERLYKKGQDALKGNLPFPISWTLEIREMTAHTYRKGTIG